MDDEKMCALVKRFLTNPNHRDGDMDYCDVCRALCDSLENGLITIDCFEENFKALTDTGLGNPYQVA